MTDPTALKYIACHSSRNTGSCFIEINHIQRPERSRGFFRAIDSPGYQRLAGAISRMAQQEPGRVGIHPWLSRLGWHVVIYEATP